MRAYSIEKVVTENSTIQIEALPFRPGEVVEVIVLARQTPANGTRHRSLQGTVLKYEYPFEPVALDDWDVLE